MDFSNKKFRLSQSVAGINLGNKTNQTVVAGKKIGCCLISEENKKLKKLVGLLRNNLSISDMNLKKSLNDNANMEYIASQNQKIKNLESRLNETELKFARASSKLEKLQQELKKLSSDRSELQEKADENEVKAETYRVMKDKALEFITKLFSDDPIKFLNLRFMELDNKFLSILLPILKKYPTIETIDLQGNLINDQGAGKISEIILNTDINLHEINLSNNKITVEGAWTLIKAVKQRDETKFKKIKKLNLMNNLIENSSDIYAKINDYVKIFKDYISPGKYKNNDIRRSSFIPSKKKYSLIIANNKESQEFIDILDRVLLIEEDLKPYDHLDLKFSESFKKNTKFTESEDKMSFCAFDYEKYEEEKKIPKIISMYSAAGDLLTSTAENFIKNGGNIDGIDVNLQETLLMHASRTGHIRLVKKLVQLGANLEVQNVIFTQKIGLTAFLIAAIHENYEILSLLSQCGSNTHACTHKGATAIHLAVKEKKPQTICRLIELGLKVNTKDHHSKTPLHYAARIGDLDLGKLLIQLGAKLSPMDFKGRTPAGLAEEKENFNFADMLEALGGKKIRTCERTTTLKDTLSVNSLQSLNDELSKELQDADKEYKKIYKNIEF